MNEIKILHGTSLEWVVSALKLISDATGIGVRQEDVTRPPVETALVHMSPTGYWFDYGAIAEAAMSASGATTIQYALACACASIEYEKVKAGLEPAASPEAEYNPLKTILDDPAYKTAPDEGMTWDIEDREITTLTGDVVTIKLVVGEKPNLGVVESET